ncbi:MAG: hypothetical protein MJ121_05390 [Clostridia bacterium]|nr:hypothetical protein [Clostridia bacterium]
MFVIAHRGACKYAPQNSLEAFRIASELGADGVETDVRVTKDGKLVLCHNTKINKLSNGKGRVSKLYYEQLQTYDFGSWFGSRYENTTIPTLKEFLDVMKDTNAGIIDIELKPVSGNDLSFVAELLYEAEKAGLTDKLLISSFDYKILNKVKSLNENVKVGFLYPRAGVKAIKDWVKSPIDMALRFNFDYLLPFMGYTSEALIRKAHKMGLKVAPWTINEITDAHKLIQWGADGLITDYPNIMKNKIESM